MVNFEQVIAGWAWNSSTMIIMLIWCLKKVNFILLNFSINGSLFSGRQNYLIYYNTVIFTSGGGAEVLVMLLLTDPRIPIRCAFHPTVQCQTSRDVQFGKKGVCQNTTRTLSNIYTYSFNP